MKIKHRSTRFRNKKREGVAAVEAALCILAIFPILFGTLEVCAGYYLQESMTIAAYEGARTAARQGATRRGVRRYVREILRDRGVDVTSVDIDIRPSSLRNSVALDPVTVTVTCPTAGNSIFVFQHLADRELTASVSFAFETGRPPADLNL